jgi:small subunit ribosomal protein S4
MLDGNGVPPDFFGDIHVRRGFAYAFDWDTFANDLYNGEAVQSIELPLVGMPGYNPDQAHYYFDLAKSARGNTGEALFQLLECRLDNVCYRLGFGDSRAQARQLTLHGHIQVNGKKVNIPSYQLKVGDTLSVKEGSRSIETLAALREGPARNVPKWLELNADQLTARVLAKPERADIDMTLSEHLVVEYYSKL